MYHLTNMTNEIEFKTQIDTEVLSRDIIITNQDEYTHAGDVMKLCKNKIKEIDDERKQYTQPLDESKKRIMAKAKSITEPLEQYVAKISKAMGDWYLQEEKKRQAEQKKLEEQAIAEVGDNPDVIVPIVESVKTTKGQVSTTTGIKYNTFEIVDESLVPREYLMLDESKIKEAINKGGVKSISGIKIVEQVRFTNR